MFAVDIAGGRGGVGGGASLRTGANLVLLAKNCATLALDAAEVRLVISEAGELESADVNLVVPWEETALIDHSTSIGLEIACTTLGVVPNGAVLTAVNQLVGVQPHVLLVAHWADGGRNSNGCSAGDSCDNKGDNGSEEESELGHFCDVLVLICRCDHGQD